jgi:hypothetical protein
METDHPEYRERNSEMTAAALANFCGFVSRPCNKRLAGHKDPLEKGRISVRRFKIRGFNK